MSRSSKQVFLSLLPQLIEGVEQTLAQPSHSQMAADVGVGESWMYMASARQSARAGKLFDTAIAALCAVSSALAEQELKNELALQATKAPAAGKGSSPAKAVGDLVSTDMGGDEQGPGLDEQRRS